MRSVRALHQLIVCTLLLITSGAVIGTLALIATLPRQTPPQSSLATLIETPAPMVTTFAPQIRLKVGEKEIATNSATLLTPTTDITPFNQTTRVTTGVFDPAHPMIWNREAIRSWLTQLSRTVNKPGKDASIVYTNKNIPPFRIDRGVDGITLDIDATTAKISATTDISKPIEALLPQDTKRLTDEELATLQARATALLAHPPTFAWNGETIKLSAVQLLSLLSLRAPVNTDKITEITSAWSKTYSTPVVEPVLQIENNVVKNFTAPKDGIALDQGEAAKALTVAITESFTATTSATILLSSHTTTPTTTLASLNTLGITESIGRGDSRYHHSIPGRIHNVSLTTSRVHAKLIMPGEEFSFNTYLGEVSKATGFQPAYVIKQGQTVLGDGGGVCQVSSTLFRALLDAGLPITERRGHSYRVSYYEENSRPGFDATVYSPHPDLRFKNDTGTAILINAVADPVTLRMYIELYGKRDGRKSEILEYKQWDAQPAPPAVYQDDPTLPPGKLKQIDWAAPGLKTSFKYKVTMPSGEVKETTYATTYIPWRAVYLRGI